MCEEVYKMKESPLGFLLTSTELNRERGGVGARELALFY